MAWKIIKLSSASTLGRITDFIDDVDGFIIRCGYRDCKTGEVYMDTKFQSFMATLAPYFSHTKVGFYFDTQAITPEEINDEFTFMMCRIEEYGVNDFPMYLQIKQGNTMGTGRADSLSKETRTTLFKHYMSLLDRPGLIIDYNYRYHIILENLNQDLYSLFLVRFDLYPYIEGIEPDGWEYNTNDQELGPEVHLCAPIMVYKDIADWVHEGTDISLYINSLKEIIFDYTGKPIEPEVENPYNLIENVDFTLTYKYNINVPTDAVPADKMPQVIVKGIHNYGGQIILPFSIDSIPLPDTVVLHPSTAEYTGSAIRPIPTIEGLSPQDYRVRYVDISITGEIGEYTVLINGRRNYYGQLTRYFTITPATVKPSMVRIDKSYEYTGEVIKPVPVILDRRLEGNYITEYSLSLYNFGDEDEHVIAEGDTDYDFSAYDTWDLDFVLMVDTESNIDVGIGAGIVNVIGINNFIGSTVLYFDIVRDIQAGEFEITQPVQEYTSKQIRPKVACLTGLVEGENYTVEYEDNVEIGTGKVIITGIYPYLSSVTLTFTISPIDIHHYYWSINKYEWGYTGEEIKPEVKVLPGDYDNMKYNFGDEDIQDFPEECETIDCDLVPEDMDGDDGRYAYQDEDSYYISTALSVECGEEPIEEKFTEDLDFVTLADKNTYYVDKDDDDGKFSYKDEDSEFDSDCIDIDGGEEPVEESFDIMYDFDEISKPKPEDKYSKDYDFNVLAEVFEEDSDNLYAKKPTYEVTYENNIDCGTGKVIITGTGMYTGTIEFEFVIKMGDIADCCEFQCEVNDEGIYDLQTLKVYDRIRKTYLVEGKDYYFDNASSCYYFPYNTSYIRQFKEITGYYNYTGKISKWFPTRYRPDVDPVVPKIGDWPVEVIFNNGGVIPGKPEEEWYKPINVNPTPEEPEEDDDDEDEGQGHSDKWVPDENIHPKEVEEESILYPAGMAVQLLNTPYYSSYENIYPEEDTLTGIFYIYSSKLKNNRIRVTGIIEFKNKPSKITGWVELDDIANAGDGIRFRVGDRVYVIDIIYKNPDGHGGYYSKAGQYMYITEILPTMDFEFGDMNSDNYLTDPRNIDFNFMVLSNDSDDPNADFDFMDDRIYDMGDEDTGEHGVVDVDFDFNTDEFDDVNFDELSKDRDYSHDVDDGNYDFNILVSSTEEDDGYDIGLGKTKNSSTLGWVSTSMILPESAKPESENGF